jgi:hypothetical protein
MSDLREDIGYMRVLAEQGRKGTIFGGVFLAAAGVVFGCACLIQWCVLVGILPAVSGFVWYLWGAAAAVFAGAVALLSRRLEPRAGGPSVAGAAFAMTWNGTAIGIAVAFAAVVVVAGVTHAPSPYYAVAPIVFAFYGTAWFVAGGQARRRWLYGVAVLSYGCALLLAWLSGPNQVLAMAAALILTLTVPGIVLMREAAR